MADDPNVIYLAGVFDGEGCITAGKYKDTTYIQTAVSANGSFYPMVRKFHDVFGFGSVNGTTGREAYAHSGTRDMWRWSATKRQHQVLFLRAVLPWLIEKRAQADVLLAFLDGEPVDVVAKLRELKRFNFPLADNEVIFANGTQHYKLNREQTLDIYRRATAGESGRELAKEYGVSSSSISKIKRGDSMYVESLPVVGRDHA